MVISTMAFIEGAMMAEYCNYLQHETKVKIIDGILAHNQDWNWLCDYLKNNYDLSDISSWTEFRKKYYRISDVFSYFIKIVDGCDTVIDTEDNWT